MKNLKNLLDSVALATAEETKQNIQEGVLAVIRNNPIIDFQTALKMLTMATNIKDHNTVVKLNKMLDAYFPVGESMEEILDTTAADNGEVTTAGKGELPPFDNASFDKMSDYIKRFLTQYNGADKHTELSDKIAAGIDAMMGVKEEEMPHTEDVILPIAVDTLEIEDLNEELEKELVKAENAYKLTEESDVVEYTKAVIRTTNLHKLYAIGDSIIYHVVDHFANLFNKNTEVVLNEVSENMGKMRDSLFAVYVLKQLMNTDIATNSPLYRYLKTALEAVEDTLDAGGWSEVINYNGKWAIICNDNTIVATAQDYEDAFFTVDESSVVVHKDEEETEPVRLAEIKKEDLSEAMKDKEETTPTVDLSAIKNN